MRVPALTLAALAVAVSIPRDAATKAPEIYPLSKVRPGQKGIGRTVFQGTKPEEFSFKVVGIARNFLPKQDIIIFESEDPKMVEPGITGGMSGSPMYIDGKVACALAYGWRFAKKAIGGCTPIEYMIRDSKLPLRGVDKTSVASLDEWEKHRPMDRFAEARDAMSRSGLPETAWLDRTPLPPAPAAPADPESGLVRASVPLSVSGLSPRAFDQAKQIFQPYGVEPMQSGGGTGDPNGGPSSFEMGGAIGVQLATGDTSIVGTGTVSYIDGTKVIGFGHPMFGMGEAYVPIVSADIITIISSVMSSFKLSSPGRVLGSLTQDRQSSIAGDTTMTAEMIPVQVKIKSGAGEQTFRADIVRHRFLTPQLMMLVVASAAQLDAPDITDATLLMKSKLVVKGYEPLVFTDYIYSNEGASPNAIASSRSLRALVPLLFNPYKPIRIERFDIEVEVAYKAEFTEIVALRVPELELPIGEKTYVEAVMRPYGGKEYVEKIPLEIPKRLAGSTVKLEVVAGDAARPDVAPPNSLDDVMAALKKTYPANTIVATIYTPDEGVAIDGKVLPDLPDSAIDTARHAASTRRGADYKSITRTVVPARRVVIGRQELVVKIEDLK
jgi:hypothetical protein